jgi:hypothetical protein
MTTLLHEPSVKEDLEVPVDDSRDSSPHHPWRHFTRQYLEMAVVMGIGMIATAFVFMVILNAVVNGDVTWKEALLRYPVLALIAVAFGMSVPMIPWMRYRGHAKRSAYEMAALMGLLAVPFICLALFDVVKGSQCGLYCGSGFVAMFALMLYRRPQYAGNPTAVAEGSDASGPTR